MKILLTGSSGRIGRAIYGALAAQHDVTGLDRHPFATTDTLGDVADEGILHPLLYGVDAVIHAAGPHAPHVDVVSDAEFERVNIEATHDLYEWARGAGVTRFVYTSTTALYGDAIVPGACAWVDEETPPQPRSVYHRTKYAAEVMLEEMATDALPVQVMRVSRCFPESAEKMAAYRLHRGVDARDVGTAHALALKHHAAAFERFILSGSTPFHPKDCETLARDPRAVFEARAPDFLAAMDARGWPLPRSVDRVYSNAKAHERLGWRPRWGWEEVMAQADRADLEVLPVGAGAATRTA
ncbi:MAG: NAD(P)-dependent oxidoreductase [Pseudomonadota bacterium]